jgi:arylsulfatase A-like enzyme
MYHVSISLFFLLDAGCFFHPEEFVEEISPKKDMLLVVMDTTRRDSFGAYGMIRDVTPNFDRLSEKGYLFENAYSAGSWTWPSHASIFTGLYPWEHGAHFTEPSKDAVSLDPDPLFASNIVSKTSTIAEVLSSQGYDCVSISANRLIGPDFPLVRGFSESYFLDDDSKVTKKVHEILQLRKSKTHQKPLFLFVNLMSAHSPWFRNPVPWVIQYEKELTPSSSPDWLKPYLLPNGIGIHPYLSHNNSNMIFSHISKKDPLTTDQLRLIKDVYEGEVHRTDHFMGTIVDLFRVQYSNYGVIVTSDHGEYWGEHGLLDHGRTLYPEVLQIPLLVLDSEISKAERKYNLVSSKDIYALISSYSEMGMVGGPLFDSDASEIYAGAERDVHWAKMLQGRFEKNYRAIIRRESMFVLSQDGECEKVFGDITDCSFQRYQYLFDSKEGGVLNTDEETLRQLQKLGYVGGDE